MLLAALLAMPSLCVCLSWGLTDELIPSTPFQIGLQETPQEGLPETEKPKKKRKLPRLKSSAKDKVTKALGTMGRAKKDEVAAESAEVVREVGRAASLECIRMFSRIEAAKRLPLLIGLLDDVIPDEDLDLVWDKSKKKASDSARLYLLRRWANSTRKDAAVFLLKQLENKSDKERFEVARGLAYRAEKKAIPELHAQFITRWTKEADFLRDELKDLPREALGASITPYLSSTIYADLIAGLRLYSLAGRPQDASLLLTGLRDNRSQVRLAAINACRMTIANTKPLTRPSMTQLVEEGESWKAKIRP